jgi:SAM-dependent methyltransferase
LLTNRGAHVWAVDISEDLIRVGQRRLATNNRGGQAQFIVGSAHDLPFPPNSIDIVFGIAILHHLDLELASKEVCRVLRPGGRAIFQEPVRNSATMRFVRRLIPYRSPDISPYERPLTDRELRSFAKGLSVTRSRAFCLPHVLVGERLPFIRKHYGALYRTEAALLRKVPGLGYYAGIRVLEVTKARR